MTHSKQVASLRFAPDVFEKLRAALPAVRWAKPPDASMITLTIDDELAPGTWCEVYTDGTLGELRRYGR